MRVRRKRKLQDTSVDDPVNISRHILKAFNLAYPADAYNGQDSSENLRAADISAEERQAWNKPKNPKNPNLKLLDSYALLPDWDATTDTGAYMMFKYMAAPINNPLDPSYDPRLDVALFRPAGQSVKDQDLFIQQQEEQKQDPTAPTPTSRFHFEFFLPNSRDRVPDIQRNFTTNDPTSDTITFDGEGEDDEGRPRKHFKYDNVRTYETSQQTACEDVYGDIVALALHDPEKHKQESLRSTKLQKAAYFYPIIQKTSIRPRRPGHVEMVDEIQRVDVIEAAGKDPGNESEKRESFRRKAEPIEA